MRAAHQLRHNVWDSGDKLGVCCSREPHTATTTADTAATAAAGDKLARVGRERGAGARKVQRAPCVAAVAASSFFVPASWPVRRRAPDTRAAGSTSAAIPNAPVWMREVAAIPRAPDTEFAYTGGHDDAASAPRALLLLLFHPPLLLFHYRVLLFLLPIVVHPAGFDSGLPARVRRKHTGLLTRSNTGLLTRSGCCGGCPPRAVEKASVSKRNQNRLHLRELKTNDLGFFLKSPGSRPNN
jgi:hypothetical protein